MSQVDRNNPKRGSASESRYSIMEFDKEFPNDAACLDYLKDTLYPDGIFCPTCAKTTTHYRVKARPAYSCQFCGHYEYPMVGTIFQGSATSLRLWFYGMYLMASTRCGISAKQLERELGVTYKTAWRMFKQIRSLMWQDDELLDGMVEVDETYIGGKAKWRNQGRKTGRGRGGVGSGKVPVQGMVRRRTPSRPGKIAAQVVDNADATLAGNVRRRVLPETRVMTDEARAYQRLGDMGFDHDYVTHGAKVYVSGDVHTNTVEAFWSHLKRGISGVYHGVGPHKLQTYVDEYVFRYNNREAMGRGVFDALLSRIEKASPETAS
jgi:transposase